MKLTGEKRSTRGKPVPVPLCPPQIPHGLTRDRNRASAVRGRRLTGGVTEDSSILSCCIYHWMTPKISLQESLCI
jgi:hypothetical protein